MTLHLLQIVSALDDDADVRLDLNDGDVWTCVDFSAPAPRLRRSMNANTMRDGINVSSSQYGERVISASLRVKSSTFEAATTEQQTLARELDRTDNWLKLQLTALDKPIFFRLFRSDMSSIRKADAEDVYELTAEFLAQSFALGERETLGPFTVTNDPDAGSNGHYFDVTGVIGDVAVPMVLVDTASDQHFGILSVRQHGTPGDLVVHAFQAEDASLSTDTTDPGGGPDAAMSGTGTNNFVTTDFGTTATMATRFTKAWSFSDAEGVAAPGTYRVLVVCRRSSATGVMRARTAAVVAGAGFVYSNPAVTIPATTNRQIVDLGLVSLEPPTTNVGGYNSTSIPLSSAQVQIQAARDSGSASIDWDYVLLVPADESTLIYATAGNNSDELVIDGGNETVYRTENGVDPFASTSSIKGPATAIAGGFPVLAPNQTNRFFWVVYSDSSGVATISKADASSVTVHYWPQYLYVRPSAT